VNIIFDLDGTLIDSKFRLYKLFRTLAPDLQISFDDYWMLKQNKITNEMILTSKLGYGKKEVTNFVNNWMELVEIPEYLNLDTNFRGMKKKLTLLGQQAKLCVCTARQYRQPAIEQLRRLELLPFFRQVLITEQKCSKESLIKQFVQGYSEKDWILGDTGKDIEVGKKLKLRTCAVTSGFQSRETLLEYSPDLVLDTAVEFSL
jgi:phosphoglycolate phosphatase